MGKGGIKEAGWINGECGAQTCKSRITVWARLNLCTGLRTRFRRAHFWGTFAPTPIYTDPVLCAVPEHSSTQVVLEVLLFASGTLRFYLKSTLLSTLSLFPRYIQPARFLFMSRALSRTVSREGEDDVVEIKKAWATGNTKTTVPGVSASRFLVAL